MLLSALISEEPVPAAENENYEEADRRAELIAGLFRVTVCPEAFDRSASREIKCKSVSSRHKTYCGEVCCN
eukprot:3745471-Rhodomonas_salina.4